MKREIENLLALADVLKTSNQLSAIIEKACAKNPWFMPDFLKYALNAIEGDMLDRTKLETWLAQYDGVNCDKTVGIIMAGNLPLVGFHDFLCCYVAGCKIKIKLSSKDDELFRFIIQCLAAIDKNAQNRIEVIERLKDFDAVIATGSDNSNRYFEYYFRNYPKIMRNSRNSVAILTGEETAEDLQQLADDIFLYFGFGCRNVSKLYVPFGYDISTLLPHFSKYEWQAQHSKYMNNYDYNRTILLLNKAPHLANDFVMLVENPALASPISTLYYEYWTGEVALQRTLKENEDRIQCIVSKNSKEWGKGQNTAFGNSQHPQLWDYADGIDTIMFLKSL